MTTIQSVRAELLPMDTTYAMFPENSPIAVLANDVALLMDVSFSLSTTLDADVVIDQLEETVDRAITAGVLSACDAVTMLLLRLAYLIMGELTSRYKNGTLEVGAYARVSGVWERLKDATGVRMSE